MLKKIRIALAALCFVCLTLLFVGIGHDWWGWLAKLQFLPAVTRLIGSAVLGNIVVVAGILLVTWVFGRIYCSVLCPLGVFQDVVIWLRRTLGKRIKPLRKKYKFNNERRWVRYPVLALYIGCLIVDGQLITALLGPYSAYGRMVTAVVGGGPAPFMIAACATLAVVVLCAWIWGRAWCNVICPVGTFLGSISKYSLFRVYVDPDKCVKCGACQHVCKASCIDSATQTIDGSRCVDCFDCIDFCKVGGLKYGRPGSAAQQPDEGRRAFIATGAMLVGAGLTARAQEMKVDGGLAPMEAKTPVEREPRLVPPGAQSVKAFYDYCTACQLCVTNCPNGVLRPSTDLEHLLQPQMGYENGFCRPECTTCSEICPAGAILPVKKEAKTLIHIGTAVVNAELCLAAKGEAGCGKCARECPVGAISMVTVDGHRRPVVAEEICIGCGKCEYLCPSRPVSAITVKGLEIHRS
ncbi:MAG: 4Fe-4S dicluster domain-containing protein [Bacteroidales bacterium]|nr:4Fe-4S dicluster domain-containing protein [Bacteroidales bacterium]